MMRVMFGIILKKEVQKMNRNKLNPICKAYRKRKLGKKTANGGIIVSITYDSERKEVKA